MIQDVFNGTKIAPELDNSLLICASMVYEGLLRRATPSGSKTNREQRKTHVRSASKLLHRTEHTSRQSTTRSFQLDNTSWFIPEQSSYSQRGRGREKKSSPEETGQRVPRDVSRRRGRWSRVSSTQLKKARAYTFVLHHVRQKEGRILDRVQVHAPRRPPSHKDRT